MPESSFPLREGAQQELVGVRGDKQAAGAAAVPQVHRWYLGGLASAAAAACTHPLDLLKASSVGVAQCIEK